MLHKARFLGVAAVVLMLGQAAYADFTADITMSGNLADPSDVAPGTAIVLTLIDTQEYNLSGEGSGIGRIQLNFDDSTAGVKPSLLAGTWTWDPSVTAALASGDGDLADLKVTRYSFDSEPQIPSDITLGTLSFNAPLVNGTYTIGLMGGDPYAGTHTYILSGTKQLELPWGPESYGGMEANTYSFTVTPEPATMFLLGAGAVVAIIRRKR